MRNIKLRNFGLGNRCADRALLNAYNETCHSFASVAHAKTATRKFCNYIRENHSIRDLRYVERSHVLAYASLLLDSYEHDEISLKTAKGYLAALNVALSNARMDNHLTVYPVSEAGFPTSSGVTKIDRSSSIESHQEARNIVSIRLGAQLELQRLFGLRFKESCLINSHRALNQALNEGYIRVEFGTKGGRVRSVPITSDIQIEALRNAAKIQGDDLSMTPKSLSWAQYQNHCYREISTLQHYNFHSERHNYAQTRYRKLVGVNCPVKLKKPKNLHLQHLAKSLNLTRYQAKVLDLTARSAIAEELGHSRVSITNAYLG
jgi:hypothetical protein